MSDAQPGMRLAQEVFSPGNNGGGAPICGRGTRLTSQILARLERLEIPSLIVEEHAAPSLHKLLAELDIRFSKVRNDSLTSHLYEIYKARLVRHTGDTSAQEA